MDEKAQIIITWTPPYTVKADFPQNPILCAFLLSEAKKAIDKYFASESNKLIQPATSIPGAAPENPLAGNGRSRF
jgi:hypothetical protein